MTDREKFEEYMLYGVKEKISLKKGIENELLIILFSMPSFIMGMKDNISWVFALLPMIFYLVFIVRFQKERKMEGIYYILHNGVFSGCISFVFALTGIKILLYLFQGKERNIFIGIVIVGYVLIILLFSYLMKKIIKRKDYSKAKKINGRFFFTLCGVLGITVARVFLSGMDTRNALEFLCVLCFFLSYLTFIGIFNIYKFLYFVKQYEKKEQK